MTVILSTDDIGSLIGSVNAVAAVEAVLSDLGNGTMDQTAPVALESPDNDALFLPMMSRSDRLGIVTAKLMCDIPSNTGRWPTQRSAVLVSSIETGECIGLLDGALITRHRTAATSAVATRYLARSDAKVLGLIGAGNLAVHHAEYISQVADIEQIHVWSRSLATVERFRERVGDLLGIPVVHLAGPREVVHSSDVVCTLTPAETPIVRGSWLRAGQHLNVVGARPRKTHREVDGVAMARSSIVVDNLPTAHAKSGDLLEAIREGAIPSDVRLQEIGQVVVGKARGRTGTDEVTLFDSVGMGALDLALAAELLELARVRGVGLEAPLSGAAISVS